MNSTFPKRLIEVDLPIKRISAHARREKSIRHGHISTLHIWWARRPLAACRAVICAALWPDPADRDCPSAFLKVVKKEMLGWTAVERQTLLSAESRVRFEKARQKPSRFDDLLELRHALLDFIADFANWDSSIVREYIDTSRALTQVAHESLGGAPGTRPLVVDPFAGGGSIPLEALRVGADVFASDLNPIPVLLNKVVLEYLPKYGQRLADEVSKWGKWVSREAAKELAEFYSNEADDATPIAYLWARTIRCEGPGCGVEVPLIRSLWLAKKANRSVALQFAPNNRAKRIDFKIVVKQRGGWVNQDNNNEAIANPIFDGSVRRGSATCPCCGYTTPVARLREQFKLRHGGANDARLICLVTTTAGHQGRGYRLPTSEDLNCVQRATVELERKKKAHTGPISLVPDEALSLEGSYRINKMIIYGAKTWGDLFSARQALCLTTLAGIVARLDAMIGANEDKDFSKAVRTLLAFAVDRQADYNSSICRWVSNGEFIGNTFGRQAIPIIWDYCEVSPLSESTGGFSGACDWIVNVLKREAASGSHAGSVESASATRHPLPTDSADALITDPPYYHAIAYATLSDFFYMWLRRTLFSAYPDLFKAVEVSKRDEIIVDLAHELNTAQKDIAFYERELTKAFTEGRRVVRCSGIGTIVFASKTTASWEAILKAVVDAGWIITGSWPIDTEMEARVAAQGQARLASSVHLVCRPRENFDGEPRPDEIGDWRDVLQELPRRIHEWMPRLAEEGVVGADAIFACLGPALEIFSRYRRVERADGEQVLLREYLEHVWAAVSKEALSMVFEGADATGFEEDSRLTAMWLWTLNAGATDTVSDGNNEETDDDGDDERPSKGKAKGGFTLEYDAARKIAQGLGAHLDDLTNLVEISGETARLLPVAERTKYLFGKDQGSSPVAPKGRKKDDQLKFDLFQELTASTDAEAAWGEKAVAKPGETTLDRVHQSMILFAAGRGEALRRFLVDDGAGKDQRFWRLAQALSALYPKASEEKRWIDGVLARKKGLGL